MVAALAPTNRYSREASIPTHEQPRVAIFQAYWRLHSNVVYAARALADAGFSVDLFLCQVDEELVRNELKGARNIAIYVADADLPRSEVGALKPPTDLIPNGFSTARQAYKMGRRFVGRLHNSIRRGIDTEYGLLPSGVCDYSSALFKKHHYVAVIGVEKGGLVWAGKTCRTSGVPLIYFSLELYMRDHRYNSKPFRRRLKRAEEEYHRHCSATIVQDERRAKLLLEDNGVGNGMDLLLVPISRTGGAIRASSNWLQRKLGLSDTTKIILVHGLVSRSRLSIDLAKVAQTFPDDWKMIFHGWGDEETLDTIRSIDVKNRTCFSLDLAPASEEADVVRSAHVGIAIYDGKDTNERLTAFSSEKIALYLQCGVPLVAFRFEGYEHIEAEGCGVLISALEDLPAGVAAIINNHAAYHTSAYSVFEKYYKFENNFYKVIQTLSNLALTTTPNLLDT